MTQSLNRNIANNRADMPYPHVEIMEPSDAVALILESLPDGELSVLFNVDGKLWKSKPIAYSALALLPLVKVSKLKLCKDAQTSKVISSPEDILEAML